MTPGSGDNQHQASSNQPEEQTIEEVRIENLPEPMQEACARAGWTELTPVQCRTIPYVLAGRDVTVQSRTGTGKTGAFLLPILNRIDPQQKACQALILAPTRELARQVEQEAEVLSRETGVRTVAVYGGVGYKQQLQAFQAGAQLVVGTPGRVLDHLIKKSLTLDKLRFLVFDEADRLLSMGFYQDMQHIREFLPRQRVDSMMFSATFPPNVVRLAERFLDNPLFINLSSDRLHVAEVEHVYYLTPRMDKDRALVRVLEFENPDAALIFCNTKMRVNYVTVVLQRFGYNADELSSDLSQSQREEVMGRMRKGEVRFMVATDVAARGIDLPELSHVIIYEPPEDRELYIHRAGRTGRAGAGGTAISLVDVTEESDLRQIARQYHIDFHERPLPSEEGVANLVAQRAIALLEAKLRDRDKLKIERMERFIPLIKELNEDDEALPLVAMLMDDFYQQAFHHPPAAIEPTAEQRNRRKPRKGKRRRRKR